MAFQQGAPIVTPAGEMVVSTKRDGNGTFSLSLVDMLSGRVTDLGGGSANTTFVDADADYIAWNEIATPSVAVQDWSIWSWSRVDRQTRKIAERATAADGTALPGPYVVPQVLDGWIYWSSVTEEEPLGTIAHTFRAPADGSGAPEIIIPNSTFVQAAGRHLVVLARVDNFNWELARYDLDDPDSGLHRLGLDDRMFMAASESLIISSDRSGVVTITDLDGNVIRTFATSGETLFAWPCAGDGWAVWASQRYSQLYLQRTDTIYTLGDRTQANWACGTGSWIGWTEGVPNAPEHTAAFTDLSPVLSG